MDDGVGEARLALALSRVFGVGLRESTIAVFGGAEGIADFAAKNRHSPGAIKAICEAGRQAGAAFMAGAKPEDRDAWGSAARGLARRGPVEWDRLTLPAQTKFLPDWESRSKLERSAFIEHWHRAAAAHEEKK